VALCWKNNRPEHCERLKQSQSLQRLCPLWTGSEPFSIGLKIFPAQSHGRTETEPSDSGLPLLRLDAEVSPLEPKKLEKMTNQKTEG
jgi:hypothetical protein